MKRFFHNYFELAIWTAAVIFIAIMNPEQDGFSFCVFKMIGLPWCPGCGLAHSMAFALHGNLSASFNAHLFGVPALLIIMHRISVLLKINFTKPKKLYNGIQ